VTPGAFDAACRALPAVTSVVQWGADQVFKVGGRIFAIRVPSGACSIKVTDIAFEALTEAGRARPAPYLARAKWVMFENLAEVDGGEMTDWIATAHALVAARLTRGQRRDLGLA
jgi:predicted DNA-binding protein (MmcQ/YjbR family)